MFRPHPAPRQPPRPTEDAAVDPSRRAALNRAGFTLLLPACGLWVRPARAQTNGRPAEWPPADWPPDAAAAWRTFTGGATPTAARVRLDVAPLIDNGNLIPVSLSCESPMTPQDHVRRLALLAPANPVPLAVQFALSPLMGQARADTRIRLATSQTLWALAETSDGRYWQHGVEVLVTLAACIEA